MNEQNDRMVSEHVLRMHRYTPPGLEEGTPVTEQMASLNLDENETEVTDTPVYQKFNKLLHGGLSVTNKKRGGPNKTPELLSIPFIKKYIHYAKSRIKPVLTKEASDYISDAYSELRVQNMESSHQYKVFLIFFLFLLYFFK